jgi:hypothetical protein
VPRISDPEQHHEGKSLKTSRSFIRPCFLARLRTVPREAALAVLMLGFVAVIPAQAADECAAFPIENRISQLGGSRTSFAEGAQVNSVASLQSQFVNYESDIRQVLDSHGLSHVADALMDSVARGEGLSEGAVQPGDDFEWMAWRREGRPVSTVPVCLNTTRSYDTYDVAVTMDEGATMTTYYFTIPKICMNIAYVGSETVTKPVAAAPAPAPAPVAAPAPQPAPVVARGSNAFFGPFIGLERRTRDLCNCIDDVSSGLLGLLGGVHIPLGSDRTHLLMQAGVAANLRESEWSTLFADIGLDFSVGERGFVGVGVGLWDINDSRMKDTNVYLHGGKDAWTWRDHTVQWFLQGRVFLDRDEVSDIGTDYAVLTGFRVLLGR